MRATLAVLALSLLYGAAQAEPAPGAGDAAAPVETFAWLAGSWVEARDGVVTREVWLAPLGGTMTGANQANRPGRRPFVEHMTITTEAAGPTFTAFLPGQPPTAFVLKPGGTADEAVFENPAHDFPQRVIYRRCGDDLCARIEGAAKGRLRSQDWRFRRAE